MLTDILVYKILSHVTLVADTAILNAFWSLEADRTHWSLRGRIMRSGPAIHPVELPL